MKDRLNSETSVPAELRAAKRWIVWRHLKGRKPPVDPDGMPESGWNEPASWMAYEDALEIFANSDNVDGIGFVLGSGFGGLDLDDCRDVETGEIDPRAQQLLSALDDCYTEISPSGKGIKAWGKSNGEGGVFLEYNFKTGVATIHNSGYFCFSGQAVGSSLSLPQLQFAGLAEALGAKAPESQTAPPLARVTQPGSQDVALFREAARLRRMGYETPEITAALWGLVQNGRFPNDPSREPWTLADCEQKARSMEKYEAPTLDKDREGRVVRSVENLRRILGALGVSLRFDAFSGRKYLTREGITEGMTDSSVNALRFEIEAVYHLCYPKDRAFDAIDVFAREHSTHPVREYLNGLKWDGVPRLDKWLITYGNAADSPYVRAVGSLPLLAAVRRVRQPGVKFDELLVLEAPQGFGKSTALAALCPVPSMFSDSLPLGSDAKQVIEGTSGTWIAEAAELQGMGARETDRLKNFLSRGTDGPVRLAYGRESEYVPRQFIVIGTTNKDIYLHDTTGGRRFWPVKVGRFNIAKLEADRDQLWAEAAKREAAGESIRLNHELWGTAGVEQEVRRSAGDPWIEPLAAHFEGCSGFVPSLKVWDMLGLPLERRTQEHNIRLGACMKILGFRRTRRRIDRQLQCGYLKGLDLKADD